MAPISDNGSHHPKGNGMENKNMGFVVNNSGMLSLLQDAGRYGFASLGLTTGGPADFVAFQWANKLCGNRHDATAIEITLGGLALTSRVDTIIAFAGAPMPVTINGQEQALWQSFRVKAGDDIYIGYCTQGTRCYLAVRGGFDIQMSFGSTATVCRESVGGINGGKLVAGDVLPCAAVPVSEQNNLLLLPEKQQPSYDDKLTLRTILAYQQQHFSAIDKRLFFSSSYQISKHWDRMGYRLKGRAIKPDVNGIVSEGICYGAIQVPADGQPIVLLNDRQTIGGYPKIGSVIASDCAKLAQLRAGDEVEFEEISIEQANNLYHLSQRLFEHTQLITYA